MSEAPAAAALRIDKWLWQARFFKTRARAVEAVTGGAVRVNGTRVAKPAHAVRCGDVLTFAAGRRIVVLRIVALPVRRGPAPEAQALYEDLSPPPQAPDSGQPEPRKGRPSREDRRTGRLSRQGRLD